MKCLIYDDRPEGCRSYPVIYEGRARLDEECPHRGEFTMSETEEATVKELAFRLKNEQKLRKSG
jgi:Fe-S-cluster containining protein